MVDSPTPPTWFITGASNGFGLLLCLRALSEGHRVVAALRSRAKSADAVAQLLDAAGEKGEGKRLKILELDMTESQASIHSKVKKVVTDDERSDVAGWTIDYLINNAGFSILGPCELFTEKEASLQLQTNLFGPLYTLQAVLPSMRTRKTGTIVNVSSIAAHDPGASSALYSASKAALDAMSASLAREITGCFGIRVLIVEPGAFRTNFLAAFHRGGGGEKEEDGRDSDWERQEIREAYEGTPADETVKAFEKANGQQPGDPVKGVERIWEAVTGTWGKGQEAVMGWEDGQVGRLFIGADAWRRNLTSAEKFLTVLKGQHGVSHNTGF